MVRRGPVGGGEPGAYGSALTVDLAPDAPHGGRLFGARRLPECAHLFFVLETTSWPISSPSRQPRCWLTFANFLSRPSPTATKLTSSKTTRRRRLCRLPGQAHMENGSGVGLRACAGDRKVCLTILTRASRNDSLHVFKIVRQANVQGGQGSLRKIPF